MGISELVVPERNTPTNEINLGRPPPSPRMVKMLVAIAIWSNFAAICVIALTPPARSYEISIYEAYPWYFWGLVVLSLFAGATGIIWGAMNGMPEKLYLAGFAALVFSEFVLFLLPVFRGYPAFGRWDESTHMGYVLDITRTGHAGISNVYPLDHIFAAIISYFTGFTVLETAIVIPLPFDLLFVSSLLLLTRSIFPNKAEAGLALAFSSIPLVSYVPVSFSPDSQAFTLVPMLVYLYFKSRQPSGSFKFTALTILYLFLVVFFHPLSIVFVIGIFLALELSRYIARKAGHAASKDPDRFTSRKPTNLVLISIAIFLLWYFSFSAVVRSFTLVIEFLVHQAGTAQVQSYVDLLARANVSFVDLSQLAFLVYGQLIIVGVISIFFSIYILNAWRKKGPDGTTRNTDYAFFALAFLVFSALSVAFFLGFFVINFERVAKYSLLFGSLLSGLAFFVIVQQGNSSSAQQATRLRQRGSRAGLYAILVVLLVVSVFNVYQSPITKKENQQLSMGEMVGAKWFFDHQNTALLTQELGISQLRLYDLLYGSSFVPQNVRYGPITRPVDHFGYSTGTSLGEYYGDQRYLVITTLGRIDYASLYPNYRDLWRFSPDDFRLLEADSSVARIYDDGSLNVYIINP